MHRTSLISTSDPLTMPEFYDSLDLTAFAVDNKPDPEALVHAMRETSIKFEPGEEETAEEQLRPQIVAAEIKQEVTAEETAIDLELEEVEAETKELRLRKIRLQRRKEELRKARSA